MRTASRGFTLIELLVAIMILALFMTAAMGAVRIASKSTTAGVVRADTTEEMRAVSDFLRRQFAQLPHMTIGEGNGERLAFTADQKNLRFVAPAPLYSRGAGLMIYTLAAKRTDDGREVLTLSYAPFDPGSERFEAIRSTAPMILTAGFETVEFEYFGAEMDKERPDWTPVWREDAEFLPSAIRIRTRSEFGGAGWPDLFYTLRSGETS
ncbi:MAG: prepilin-type N-terminal cleavage/methylation domain-containing protein [Planctomycetota bacterium]